MVDLRHADLTVFQYSTNSSIPTHMFILLQCMTTAIREMDFVFTNTDVFFCNQTYFTWKVLLIFFVKSYCGLNLNHIFIFIFSIILRMKFAVLIVFGFKYNVY
jgi:hypothetical protein